MISSNEETPVPPDWNRGSQVNHEAKQREGWSLPNKSGEPPHVTGNILILPLQGTKANEAISRAANVSRLNESLLSALT